MNTKPEIGLDFNDTEIAFGYQNDSELKRLKWLFRMMNNPFLVTLGSVFTPTALKINLPFVKSSLKATIFKQFVGGETLLDTQKSIDLLYKYNVLTILDYGAEAKTTKEELDGVMQEIVKAVEFAASNSSVPIVVTKLSGLADNQLLIRMQSNSLLTDDEENQKSQLIRRLDSICKRAHDLKVGVMIDAEESWVQITIDSMVEEMMEKYNKKEVIVFNTFQLYRNDKLDYLKASYDRAMANGYMLGAKLVRGAYMDKERNFAKDNNVASVINDTKEDTDRMYNDAVTFCMDNYNDISSACATHNVYSSMLQARLIDHKQIPKNHAHVNFCQLYGMSDNITFNLAKAGYNVAKYLPYGPLKEVIPYLIRRAKENTSITGDMSRELQFITQEINRRGI